jgi:hypothetical protein
MQKGQFTKALAALRRGHELGSKNPSWPYPSAQWVRQTERLVELDATLPQILSGKAQPANTAERLELARFCQGHKKLYAAAARFYEEALAAEPKQTDNLQHQHRYNAARAAALAGCGQGKDAQTLSDKESARLRQQARDWLQADLTAWRQRLVQEPDKVPPVVLKMMVHWQQDKDFVGVRDPKALAQLPEAEHQQWRKLWQEVEALRKSATDP